MEEFHQLYTDRQSAYDDGRCQADRKLTDQTVLPPHHSTSSVAGLDRPSQSNLHNTTRLLNINHASQTILHNIVREYVFYVFFENPKNATLRFFEAAF